jgi:hypothetical protein
MLEEVCSAFHPSGALNCTLPEAEEEEGDGDWSPEVTTFGGVPQADENTAMSKSGIARVRDKDIGKILSDGLIERRILYAGRRQFNSHFARISQTARLTKFPSGLY